MRSLCYRGKWLNSRPREKKWNLIRPVLIAGKVKAIVELPAPKNVSEMHQLFGTIDYLGKFLPNLSDVKNPISELLKANSAWIGLTGNGSLWKGQSNSYHVRLPAFYDVNKPTVVSTDASSYGLWSFYKSMAPVPLPIQRRSKLR